MKPCLAKSYPLSALAAALCCAFGPALAQDAEDIASLTKPSSNLEIGIGYVSDDNQRFGQYTGLTDKGGYGLLDIDINRRDALTGTWMRLTGRNLGFENREIRFEHERQGDWGYFLEFSQTPRFDPFTVTTQLTGIGTTAQAITGSATPREYHLKTERDAVTVGFDKMIAKGFGLQVSLRNEEKTGERLWGQGTFGTWRFLTDPIDQTSRQLEAKLNYSTDALQLSGGYYGTTFENKNNRLDVTGPALFAGSNEIALPPDNESHQFYLAGGYNFSRDTRANFKLSYGRITQNELFPNTPVAGAPTSLDGRIDTTLLQGGLTTRVTPKLSLRADLRYEDRDDKTPIFRYFPSQNTATSTNDGTNEARDIQTTSGKIEAKYRLPNNFNLTGGLDYVEKKRNSPPVRSVDFRETTDETAVRAELRRTISETLSGAVSAIVSQRRGSDWLPNLNNGGTATTGDLIAPLHLIDRDRNTMRLTMNWMPTEPLSVGFRLDYSDDDYKGRNLVPNDLGPREGTAQFLSLDAAYRFSDTVQGTAWGSRGENTFKNALCQSAAVPNANTCTASNASPVWGADLKNISDAFGLGLVAKITAKIDLTADLAYSKVKDEMGLQSIDPANSTAVTVLPDTSTKITTLKLSAKYALQRNSAVRLIYVYDRYETDDWTWANWNYSPADGGTTVRQDPDQKVNFLGVSYYYSF
ncbi:MAG: MtrB/PioB family decaheme-associated outer membrane protein [Betaproteobacteria bacterium]|nr:MtrB/PioB family decaheme-associated outer membrane protein [Betaproteobacteria bacterium]MDH5220691.1 MtrB/PioB family decaheme-associated outer membrane protein [Betaproteobacteria bacterium]MDH5349709.1 MtrB/PioB family decaheme-associated outer membrane protein [Betaproteobacteria bacterium]